MSNVSKAGQFVGKTLRTFGLVFGAILAVMAGLVLTAFLVFRAVVATSHMNDWAIRQIFGSGKESNPALLMCATLVLLEVFALFALVVAGTVTWEEMTGKESR